MAVASLVLGIISLAFGAFGSGLQWVGAILAIVGIILGAKNNNPEKAGMAKAGKVCSIIGLILCLVMFVACIACAGAIGSGLAAGASLS